MRSAESRHGVKQVRRRVERTGQHIRAAMDGAYKFVH